MFGLSGNAATQNGNSQLQDAIKAGALLVDVRTPGEFAEGSVPGAINIPLDTLSYEFEQLQGDKAIVVFCRSGNRSGMAKVILAQSGITNVIDGGTWQNVNKLMND